MTAPTIRWLAPAALTAILTFTAAQGAPAAPAVVELHTFMFSPNTLTVTAGTRVTWKNRDPEPHTVASVDGKFRSGALDEGDSFSFTFNAPGTYRYVCSIHPQMVGAIVVTPAKR
jgi:plastocyanin